jgi:hypothetical protein
MYDWVDHVSFLHVLYPILGRPDWSISLLSISFNCLIDSVVRPARETTHSPRIVRRPNKVVSRE